MPGLDEDARRWVLDAIAPGARISNVRGLREGGTPWLITLDRAESPSEVILRIGGPSDGTMIETEVAALEVASTHGIAAPELLAWDSERVPPLILIGVVDGASAIPLEQPTTRLRNLGAAAARLHATDVPMSDFLPWRDRPIAGVDFAALRREQTTPLLQRAEAAIAQVPDNRTGFLHGDLWQGNAMWQDDELIALIDWDCAGVGPAGVDLGSLRCDAAICFGLESAVEVLRGWEDEAGRPADDVPYWDIVAALSTPTDMGWFTDAIVDQGRSDLGRKLLVRRRDEFLESALDVWSR